jgi:CO/xanthine dehydrogenase Mo-binding subunit
MSHEIHHSRHHQSDRPAEGRRQAHDRIDGPLKTTGTAPYAYEQHAAAPNAAYGYVVGAAIAKGRIASIDTAAAKRAPGVLAIVTYENAGKLGKGKFNTATLLAGPRSSTTTRPWRWWWPRPSSRRAPRQPGARSST